MRFCGGMAAGQMGRRILDGGSSWVWGEQVECRALVCDHADLRSSTDTDNPWGESLGKSAVSPRAVSRWVRASWAQGCRRACCGGCVCAARWRGAWKVHPRSGTGWRGRALPDQAERWGLIRQAETSRRGGPICGVGIPRPDKRKVPTGAGDSLDHQRKRGAAWVGGTRNSPGACGKRVANRSAGIVDLPEFTRPGRVGRGKGRETACGEWGRMIGNRDV